MVRETGTLIAIGAAAALLALSPLIVSAAASPLPAEPDSGPSVVFNPSGGTHGRLLTGGLP